MLVKLDAILLQVRRGKQLPNRTRRLTILLRPAGCVGAKESYKGFTNR
jgi:hypothetical protein